MVVTLNCVFPEWLGDAGGNESWAAGTLHSLTYLNHLTESLSSVQFGCMLLLDACSCFSPHTSFDSFASIIALVVPSTAWHFLVLLPEESINKPLLVCTRSWHFLTIASTEAEIPSQRGVGVDNLEWKILYRIIRPHLTCQGTTIKESHKEQMVKRHRFKYMVIIPTLKS